jgi:hypothetical protein
LPDIGFVAAGKKRGFCRLRSSERVSANFDYFGS